MFMLRRLGVCAIIFALSISARLSAGDSESALPKAFDKTVPESVKDLQDIEAHVKKLLGKVIPATVGLRIGGSSGSGVIIDKDGTVLTAAHVSGQPDQIVQIILHDGKKLKGKTLGGNRGIDSGMLKITDPGPFPFVEMGDLTDVKTGTWCMAVGHPNGYHVGRSPVVRLGRVLEINKDKKTGKTTYLRSDCTLVGGDSGGPLFDMHGKVVGIHSRIGPFITANIHVPVDTFVETFDRLAKGEVWGDALFGGKKGRPKNAGGDAYLGIKVDPNAKDCRLQFVNPDSPAGRAGLRADDIIVSIDGRKIANGDEYDRALRFKQPGNLIAVEVRRGEETLNLKITLSKRTDKS